MRPTTAQQVADIISAIAKIAWPLAVVVLLLRYREAIQRIVGKREVSKFSLGPVSAEFAAVTRTVEAAAEEAGIDDQGTEELGVERNLVEELARADPRAAVATSWARVRNASGIAVARRTNERLRSSTVGRLEQLRASGLLQPELVELGRTLKTMETTVSGQPQSDIPVDFARVFSLAAISLAKKISELIPEGYDQSTGGTSPSPPGLPQTYSTPPLQAYPQQAWYGSPPQAAGTYAYYGSPPQAVVPYPGYGSPPQVSEDDGGHDPSLVEKPENASGFSTTGTDRWYGSPPQPGGRYPDPGQR